MWFPFTKGRRHRPLRRLTGDVPKLLTAACGINAPAVAMSPDVGVCCRARLAALDGESVSLFLLQDWAEVVFMPRSLVCVTFNAAERTHVFITTIREYSPQRDPATPARLVLEPPRQIAAAEARRCFRVLVGADSGLAVALITGDNRVWRARARDISLSGMLVEFDETGDPDLDPLARVTVELVLGEDLARLSASVRRRTGGCYGLFFPEAAKEGAAAPPPSLRKIVETLERQQYSLISAQSRRAAEAPL